MYTTPPPIPNRAWTKDAEHVKLISIFHFVLAGLMLLGLLTMILQISMMHDMFENPAFWQQNPAFQHQPPPPPKEFFVFFKLMMAVMGTLNVIAGALNVISGFCIRKRKGRMFTFIVAGIDCLLLPFGTVLGIFTFVVLTRPSVRAMYEESPA
ncbi:MAG TPA: hypothetical protein VG733_14275 [Chthoniobacteraceae bacterium]|nr:hypothetical protein [Chthoniobacteraceae bacterium]